MIELWDTHKRSNIGIIGVPEERKEWSNIFQKLNKDFNFSVETKIPLQANISTAISIKIILKR